MIWRFMAPKRVCITCALISFVAPYLLGCLLSFTALNLALDAAWLAQSEGYRIEKRKIVGWDRPELNDPYWIERYESDMQWLEYADLCSLGLIVLSLIPTTAFALGACFCQEMEDKKARREIRKAKRTQS